MPRKSQTSTAPLNTGFRIKGLREKIEAKEINRHQLHFLTQISYQTLVDLEDERLRDYVSARTVYALMKALDCSYHDLIEFVVDGEAQ